MKYEKYFDHTILKPDASEEDIIRVCREAAEHDFASVCVNPYRTALAASQLRGSTVKVCTVVGFPLGASATQTKVFEAAEAIQDGAQEIDMVINIGALKDRNDAVVCQDIEAVRQVCKSEVILKVILETCLLTEEEKRRACRLAVKAGADFVKTSTGFSTGGAVAEDVALMKQEVGDKAKVKASGGIRDRKTADAMIAAGADRLGTSATIEIVKKEKITTIVFDIGNVLAEFDWKSYIRQFGFSKDTEDRIAKATFLGENWREQDRGDKTDEEIYANCLREIPDLEKELSLVWADRTTIVKEYDYASRWITALKEKGYRVYLLSNYGRTTFAEAKRQFSFLNDADGMVISYEIRHIKPEPEIYQELIRRYQIVPEETIFIDDLLENIEAAKEMGFHTILFTNKEEVERNLVITNA